MRRVTPNSCVSATGAKALIYTMVSTRASGIHHSHEDVALSLVDRRLLHLLCSSHRIPVRLEAANDEPLVDGHEEYPALEFASDEPTGVARVLAGDDPSLQEVRAPPRRVDVPLVETRVEASHRTLRRQDDPMEEREALHPNATSGQVSEARRHSPAVKGWLPWLHAVPALCKREPSVASLPGNGASTSKRKVERSPERHGGLSAIFSAAHSAPSK
eukprot:scaffold17757_cov62-Phaeocystis_antarctica.AAC.6